MSDDDKRRDLLMRLFIQARDDHRARQRYEKMRKALQEKQ